MADTPDDTAESSNPEHEPELARFEASIADLETLVESLESGDATLEEALGRFERGIALARRCQGLLKNAELRVDQLLADDRGEHIADFDAESDRH